jgi:hypothetical protein
MVTTAPGWGIPSLPGCRVVTASSDEKNRQTMNRRMYQLCKFLFVHYFSNFFITALIIGVFVLIFGLSTLIFING